MSTLDLLYDSANDTRQSKTGVLSGLLAFWEAAKRRRRERRLAIELSSLDAHLLRDIGIEPQDVTAALHGRPGPSILFHPMRSDIRRK